MKLFDPRNHHLSARHRKIHAITELLYNFVDFLAALLFVIGSVLFFSDSTTYLGTWLFLIGSILFGARPTIKLCREVLYLREGIDPDAPPSQDKSDPRLN